jgi:hypothetical protein
MTAPNGQPQSEPVPRPAPPVQQVQIITERRPQRFEAVRRRHAARAHIALVVVTSRGTSHTFRPDDQPTVGELLWKRISSMYEVDVGQHQAQYEDELPSGLEAVPFQAVVDLQWQVINPTQVVRKNISTLDRLIEALRPELLARLRPISRQYTFSAAAGAEEAMNRALSAAPMGTELGLLTRPFIRLNLEQGTRGHAGAMLELKRNTEMEELKQRLRMLEEGNRQQLVSQRMTFYRQTIEAGDTEKFVLLMAQNPDDLPEIMQAIRQDRDLSRQQAIEFFQKLAESGLIERHEMSDVVRETLAFLHEGVGRVLPNNDPLALGTRRRRSSPGDELPPDQLTNDYQR